MQIYLISISNSKRNKKKWTVSSNNSINKKIKSLINWKKKNKSIAMRKNRKINLQKKIANLRKLWKNINMFS